MVEVRRIGVAAVVGAVALAVAGCGSKQDDGSIVIGVVTAQTGTLASYDQPSLAGFRLAIDEINARGGLGGKHPVKLLVRDTRSDTATTASATQELVDAGAKIMITPCDADPSIVAGQITQPAGVPTLTFCGSSPILPGAVGDMMFTTYPTDNLQAAALAKYAYESGLRKVYLLVSPDTTYTSGLPEYFGRAFTTLGGTVVGKGSYAMNQPDFSVAVTTIRNLKEAPDLIMTAAYEPDFPAFIRQLRAAGVSTPVFGADALGTPTIAGLNELSNGVVFTSAGCSTPGSKLEEFNQRFKQAVGHEPSSAYEVNGYEIGLILDAALQGMDEVDGTKIRDALADLDNFQGVTGSITYRGTQRIPVRSVALLRYEGGKAQCVQALTPAASEIPAPL
ncbi:ABC transporter substrate-binding protein [Steroidobacter sp.]|uniref:ABC transporter substrate-binding protein n=1 Tax=Steroidobacter sp. TaxID=1978227 RepID=UPI001A5A1BE8|nr:ABC transporter substrate-binding protein [Steroidobacter sp.]MBL8270147.1 ABC transporter substrate-binding protein [Steroidobacter sp.]